MLHANRGPRADLDGQDLKIGIVAARFNAHVCDVLLAGAQTALRECGVADDDITVLSVPGALEIPLALQALAQTENYDALIALGCVIRGDTYHFEIVANECNAGITRVTLDFDTPIGNGVLTVDTEAQAQARLDKGAECARVAVEMARLLQAR
jgi:6,7-dimethyl-8-ribityllumazine synthase